MKAQIIKDSKGEAAGVFIPIKDWLRIKGNYPDIEDEEESIQKWEKDLIDQRLDAIAQNPERLKSDDQLFKALKRGRS